jgi:CHAT domain-containing protein
MSGAAMTDPPALSPTAAELLSRIARSAHADALETCFTAPRQVLLEVQGHLQALADEYEYVGAGEASSLVLALVVRIAEKTESEKVQQVGRARLDFRRAMDQAIEKGMCAAGVDPGARADPEQLRQGLAKMKAAGLRELIAAAASSAADVFEKHHEPLRAFRSRMAAAGEYVDARRIDDAIHQATGAVSLLPPLAEISEAQYRDAIMRIYEFCRRLLSVEATSHAALFFAKTSRVLKDCGEIVLADCIAAHLGSALVRLGEDESGLEILSDLRALRRYELLAHDGSQQPVPEADEADYWHARACDRVGREERAEAFFRGHAWLKAGGWREAELHSRLVDWLIENERYQQAWDLLAKAPDASLPDYTTLVFAQRAKIAYLLRRPIESDQSRRRAAEILKQHERTLEMLDTREDDLFQLRAEAMLRARLALVECAILTRSPADLASADTELAQVTENVVGCDATTAAAVSRLKGDHAFARGDYLAASQAFREALNGEIEPAARGEWIKSWAGDESFGSVRDKLLQAELRDGRNARGVGMNVCLRLARSQAMLGLDPLAELDKTIQAAERRNRLSTLFYAEYEKGEWLLKAGNQSGAITCFERAADVLESLRAELREVELQVGALVDKEAVYSHLLRHSMHPDADREDGVRIMERCKARGLLDEISGVADDAADSDSQRALLAEDASQLRRQFVRAMAEQIAPSSEAPDSVQMRDIAAKLESLRGALADVFKRQFRSSRIAPARGATPDEIRLFSAGQVLLHYFCDRTGVFVVAIVDGEIHRPRLLPQTQDDTIRDLLQTFSFELEARIPCRTLEELYRLLVAPLEDLIKGQQRVLIIPHDFLHVVPFHALRRPDERYLIEDLTFSYAPSGAIALRSAMRLVKPLSPRTGSIGFALDATGYLKLAALSEANEEVAEAMADIDSVELHIGASTARRAILDLAGEINILHIACHGEFDPVDPLLSRLYLFDGPLYAYELLAMRANPRLVVLSACETGRQTRQAGDEVFGLIRPFLRRGAAGIVATLWKVNDVSTRRLMRQFYDQVTQGADPAASLRAAQTQLLSSSQHSHPYFWAPYLLVGAHLPPKG